MVDQLGKGIDIIFFYILVYVLCRNFMVGLFCKFFGFGCRYIVEFFLESVVDDGIYVCLYFFVMDMDMELVLGYKFVSWEVGYGDIYFVFDMKILWVVSWYYY